MSRVSLCSVVCAILLFGSVVRGLPQQTQSADPATLLTDGERALHESNFNEAASKFQQALKAFEQTHDQKGMGLALFRLGVSYNRLSQFGRSEPALNRALKIHQTLGDQQAYGSDLNELAYIAMKQSDYEKSLLLSQKALSIHEPLGNKKGIADAHRNMGYAYEFQGDYENATDHSQRSLDTAVEIGDKEGQAMSFKDLGGIQWRLSNYDRALEYYEKGMTLAKEIGAKGIESALIGNMGLIYWNRGDLNEALRYSNESLQLAEQIQDQQSVAITEFNIGAIYNDLEDYGKAQDTLQKALAMSEKIGDKGLAQACLDGLGQVQESLGNNDIALDFMQKAAKIAEEIHEDRSLAYDLRNIAELHEKNQKSAEALVVYKRALQLFEKMDEKRGIALVLNDIGGVYVGLNKLEEAIPCFEKAMKIGESIGSKALVLDSYRWMGWIYHSKKNLSESEKAFTQSVALAREFERPDLLWQGLYGEGVARRDAGKTGESLKSMEEAADVIENARSQVPLAEQRAGYMQEKMDVYESLIQLLVESKNIPLAFEYAQRAKARSFLDMLAEARIDPQGNLDPELKDRKKKLLKDLMSAQRDIQNELESDKPDPAKVRQLSQKRTDLDETYSRLTLEIRKQAPQFADVEYPKPLGLTDAQELLDNQSVLLEYFLGSGYSVVFVITREDAQAYSIPSEKILAQQIQEMREVLLKPEPVWEISEHAHTRYAQLAAKLYDETIKPAESYLSEKAGIVIAPDGILNYLPFESLLRKRPAPGLLDFSRLAYLALDFDIQYVPSSSVLSAMREIRGNPVESQKELFALADPARVPVMASVASRTRGSASPYAALPNARIEVADISKIFPTDKVTVLEGQDASEENVKGIKLNEYKRLHFASHGIVDEVKPQFSSIVLNGNKSGNEDGFLTMPEIFDLNLKADLVVLSACKTGLGKQVRGEGVMGLSRAFLSAGASSVLVSLWNVYDKSTAGFMTEFYKNMESKGMSKAAALKEARIRMIQSKLYGHPYYWAPFVLIGNP